MITTVLENTKTWLPDLSIHTVIMIFMMVFMVIGAIDKMTGNHHGYGEKFEEGFKSMGSLALSMVGIVAAAPLIAELLEPVITPVYTMMGADPSMFATTLLACDMGGYPLAMELAKDPSTGTFAGLILGTMMGPTIVFTIPVALGILSRADRPFLGAGVMAGLSTIPFGCVAGGLAMNLLTDYHLDLSEILLNLIPVIVIAGLLVLGLWISPEKMISGFHIFGKSITIITTILCMTAVFEQVTGIMFPLLDRMVLPGPDGLTPLDSGLLICGQIGIVLAGAFPMVEWITRTFEKSLKKAGAFLGINEKASAGIISSFAHVITTLALVKDMNPRGRLVCIAFSVSAASVFGAHLGFTAGVDPDMVLPVIIGKLTAGILAIFTAVLLDRHLPDLSGHASTTEHTN